MGNLFTRLNSYRLRMKNLTDVFEGRVPKVLIIGLDGAGKTALLYRSKLDDSIFANTPPRGINIEHMKPKRGARIQLYDMPGSKITRHLWYNWFPSTEAVVYVVDSADQVRIDEAKFELHDLLKSRHLRKVPLIVVANKQDAEGALTKDQVGVELDLSSIEDRDWSSHAVSTQKATGVKAVFEDVVEKIKAFRHYKRALGSPLKETDSVRKKTTSIEDDSVPEFTNIEDADTNDNEKIPSLFESINNSRKETDLDAESDVFPSTSTSSNDQPMYARPSGKGKASSVTNGDGQSGSEGNNPTPDSVSTRDSEDTASNSIPDVEDTVVNNMRDVEDMVINNTRDVENTASNCIPDAEYTTSNITQNVESTVSNSTQDVEDTASNSIRDVEEIQMADVDQKDISMRNDVKEDCESENHSGLDDSCGSDKENSDDDCVKNLQDIVKAEEMDHDEE